jgi:cardiolipin synthase
MSQENLHWSSVKIYQTGDPYFNDLMTDLRLAQKSITIEVYIFEIDPLTTVILQELGEAKKRGCEVHILVDGFGSYFWLNALERETRKLNLAFQIFQPFPRTLGWFRQFLFPFLSQILGLLKRLNHRDHRKIVLIDEKIAYLGSLNMTQVHSQERMGIKAWKDTGLRLTGGSLSDLNRSFWMTWNRAPRMTLRRFLRRRDRDKNYDPKKSLVRLNSTTWSRYWLYRDLLRRIKTAESRIWIETAYFLPKRSLLRALKKAARRGIDVQIIVPAVTDFPIIKWAAEALIHALSEAGVAVFEFKPRVLHSKFFIIDQWATIGSHNWNHRSFLHDLEVEAIIHDPPEVEKLCADWRNDQRQSSLLTIEDLRPKNSLKAWLGRLAFRLRYLF